MARYKIKAILLVLVLQCLTSVGVQAESLVKVFDQVNSAVVVLYTSEHGIPAPGRGDEVSLPGLGSGVLIDKEGHVITAAHVVQTADKVTAEFSNGTKINARVIASDPLVDLALLKLESVPENIIPVKLGDSEKVKVGEEVFVIGAPYGYGHTLTVGHISGRHQQNDEKFSSVESELFQTDAAINQGNSGGPMFNMQGEVIGIVSYIMTKSGGYEGLGFAVTTKTVQKALFDNRKSWSGMSVVMLTGEVAKAFNLPQEYGLLIQKIAHDSPAELAGLKPGSIPATIKNRPLLIGGDIILSVDGILVTEIGVDLLREHMSKLEPDASVEIQILREGEVRTITSYR